MDRLSEMIWIPSIRVSPNPWEAEVRKALGRLEQALSRSVGVGLGERKGWAWPSSTDQAHPVPFSKGERLCFWF